MHVSDFDRLDGSPLVPTRHTAFEGFERRRSALASRLMDRGAFSISIDLELAWGIWDRPSAEYHRLCAEKERAVVGALLSLLSSRQIPATWAIVARLLENADPPAPSPFGERIWYGPDLIEAIQRASPPQDIGSHGFAHLYFRDLDREAVRADVQSAHRVHQRHGLPFTSFVFPRNQVAHLESLAEEGIEVFRGVDRGWHMATRWNLGELVGKAANLADKVLPIPPVVVLPSARSGLVELPGSMLLLGRSGLRRLVRPEVMALKAELGLLRAARQGGVFHLWCHPSNFYWDTEVQLGVLEGIFDRAFTLRERGELEIRTMASYAQA